MIGRHRASTKALRHSLLGPLRLSLSQYFSRSCSSFIGAGLVTARSRRALPAWVPRPHPVTTAALAFAAVVGVVIVVVFLNYRPTDSEGEVLVRHPPDAESLAAAPGDADRLLLGQHGELVELHVPDDSRVPQLDGQTALALAVTRRGTTWAGGRGFLARRGNDESTWSRVRPEGLPDKPAIAAIAAGQNSRDRLLVAIENGGLYESRDAGSTWTKAGNQRESINALAIGPTGRIYAASGDRGVLSSADGGRTWREWLNVAAKDVAASPFDPSLVLVAGPGILRTSDGGRHFTQVFDVRRSIRSITFSGDRQLAYAASDDGVIFVSASAGRTWKAAAKTRP